MSADTKTQSESGHSDIISKSWISALPKHVHPYVYLARLDRPIGIWLLAIPGWWSIVLASGGWSGLTMRSVMLFALFGAGAVIMRAAGCVINDLWDRKIDAQVARTQTRPLAAGDLKPWQAVLFLVMLLLMGLGILLQLNQLTIILGFAVIPLIIIYPLMKRITFWPQAFLGLTFNFGALMGWSAVTGEVGMPAILLFIAGLFWTLGYDTIYAHQDKEDDLLAGIKSTALLFKKTPKALVIVSYSLHILLISAAVLITSTGYDASKGFLHAVLFQDNHAFIALYIAALHLIWQIRIWQPDQPQTSLQAFKSNSIYGILVLLALLLV